MMRVVLLRPLTIELVSLAVELDRLSLGNLWSAEGYVREISSSCSDLLTFQETKNSIPQPSIAALGCSWAILEEAHITIVAVHPNYQQQGLGQAMLLALLKAASQRGLERATLEVRVSNRAAIALYQKFGFQEAGRRQRYYQDTGEDALVMWLGGLHQPRFFDQLKQWQYQVTDRLQQSGWRIESDPGIYPPVH